MQRIAIEKIVIGSRHRQDMGDIESLADSIQSVGLLQPIVIDKANRLIAGMRRIEACKLLGWSDVPTVIADNMEAAVRQLVAERDENTCRKDFTVGEATRLGRELEKLEKPKAKERQKSGKNQYSEPAGNFPEGEKGRVRDKVGEAVGMGGRTFHMAKTVQEAAEQDPETFGPIAEEMERTNKVTPAYNEVQRIKAGKRPIPKDDNGKPVKQEGVGVLRANDAIDCLLRIPKDDPLRRRGFQIVSDWIKANLKG